ncbi:hypothetical protein KP509_23G044000 [Ceratopteris richardii]|uniref:Protein FLX-like 3 n=1 Tax=Ceratopteris richardii TaxID=49495 RepID=A0A8T2S2D5_CERRI|nr:hypothetical protein KP509_23G044000 [Ceratopteris richardii]KAH7301803.1 hypothetical protein KP509_23G044000 [Ceratopteris richardii]
MAGRGKLVPPMPPARGPVGVAGGPRPGVGNFGLGIRPGFDGLPPTAAAVEEKLAIQHAEIQRLITENQRLAATHVALRQELAAAQQEVQRLQQVVAGVQTEREQQYRGIAEKSARMEAELRSLEPLKMDLQKAQADAQKLFVSRQELSGQVQQLTQELHRSKTDAQQMPSLKAEVETFRKEIQHIRTAFEYEKKANTELLEQRSAMEKNIVSMAREVEKLRAELATMEKKARSGYGGGYGPEAAYSSVPSYADGYGMGQMGSAVDGGVSFGAGGLTSWGAYEAAQRGGVPHPRK